MDSAAKRAAVALTVCAALVARGLMAAPAPPPPPPTTLSAGGGVETGRIFWSGLGDILESLPFLPFTVNVPDALSSMWSYVSGWLPGGSGDAGSRPPDKKKKKPKRNYQLTRGDLVDYFLYDR